jgi:hypothetical protein
MISGFDTILSCMHQLIQSKRYHIKLHATTYYKLHAPRWQTGHVEDAVAASRRSVKRLNPLRLNCDTITSHRRLVNTFIHQIVLDLLK